MTYKHGVVKACEVIAVWPTGLSYDIIEVSVRKEEAFLLLYQCHTGCRNGAYMESWGFDEFIICMEDRKEIKLVNVVVSSDPDRYYMDENGHFVFKMTFDTIGSDPLALSSPFAVRMWPCRS